MFPLSNRVSRCRPRLQRGQALQIEQPAHHQGFLSDIVRRPSQESAESVVVFGFAPQLFDSLPGPLADQKSEPSFSHANPFVSRVPASLHRGYMGLNAAAEQSLDKFLFEESFVGPQCFRPQPQAVFGSLNQLENTLSLRRWSLKNLNADSRENPVAIFHHRVDRVGRGRRLFAGLGGQSSVWVAGGTMRRVRPLLASKIHIRVSFC